MSQLAPISDEHEHFDIGRDTFVLSPEGTPLRFTPIEKKFLVALDETHDLSLACQAVQKDEEWGRKFFKKPKIHEWMTKIAQEHAVKTGTTVQWFRSQLLSLYRGSEIWWEGTCGMCNVYQKVWVEPEGGQMPCGACQSMVVDMRQFVAPIKKSREQLGALVELGNRIDPKIERVNHEFNDESFIFKAQGENA